MKNTKNNFQIESTLTIFSPDTKEAIVERILSSKEFTNVLDNDPKRVKNHSIALICFEGEEITHICYLRKGQRVATGQVRVRASDIISIRELPFNEFLDESSKSFRKLLKRSFGIGYQSVPPKTGEEMLNILFKLRPESKNDILKLFSKTRNRSSTIYQGNIAVEKDAVGICLDIFGLKRSKINTTQDQKNIGESFLSGLEQYTAYEDDIIFNDVNNFPGYAKIKDNIIGTAEFQNDAGEKLIIINANRKPVEKDLGVDLIYFNRRYSAFTLVQYKMMDRGSSGEIYFNPNQESHEVEIERMNEKLRQLVSQEPDHSLDDYRLSRCPIFFKLCKKLTSRADNFSIAAGAYIPLDQWNLLIKDSSTLGPQGGRQIGYHTLKNRYLGTQGFVELVQKGFIGTNSISSEDLGKYIEERIKNGSSVLYAIDESKD